MQPLTAEQIRFFETFGFLKLKGLVRDQISEITREFEAVFPDRGCVHDGGKRTCVVPFIDSRAQLCALLDHAGVRGAAASLLGPDFNYIGSDGNYYTGDTPWHSDGYHTVGQYVKFAFYLDEVGQNSGALRVIPGSHRLEFGQWQALQAMRARELWGVEQADVPHVVLPSEPGDVLVFNHNLMHASFGGSSQRRMFTINLCRRAQNQEEVEDLKAFLGSMARFWIDRAHGAIMRETASPDRMVHLQQVIEHEGHLPALAAQARATMTEPARG